MAEIYIATARENRIAGNCPGSGFSLRQTKGPGQFGGVLGQGFDDGPTLLLGG
jgi:hypothetical protein